MKVIFVSAAVLILSSICNSAVAENRCDKLIDDKTERLKKISTDLQTTQDELSTLRNCKIVYDDVKTTEQTIIAKQDDYDRLSQEVNVLSSELENFLDEITARIKLPDVTNDEPNLNAVLADRLAYRELVKSWQLRDSAEVSSKFTDLDVLDAEIIALLAQLDTTSGWQDRENLEILIVEERQLTQKLTKLQSELSSLQQKRADPNFESAKQLQNDGPERAAALAQSAQEIVNQIETLEQSIENQIIAMGEANDRINDLDNVFAKAIQQYEALKSQLASSTQDLTSAQIEKNRLLPVLQSVEAQETVLTANLEQMLPQAEATQAIVDQLQLSLLEKSEQIAEFDEQIEQNSKLVEELQSRVDAANSSITAIRGQMASAYRPLGDLKNVENQVFALELTVGGLDKEIDNLDMLTSGAEGKLNRFIRACKREPACKSALSL